jgi:hypothetical protein
MRKLLALGLLAAFVFSVVIIGCGPSEELIAYHEAKIARDDACDEYQRLLDLNETYKDELDSELSNLETIKSKHEKIHKERNEMEKKRGEPITPLLHGKEDPEEKIDWL